jgi:hypothetical protein
MSRYPAVEDVVVGTIFGDSNEFEGEYPLSATTAAAQLATDVAAVEAKKFALKDNVTVLGVFGTDPYTNKTLGG